MFVFVFRNPVKYLHKPPCWWLHRSPPPWSHPSRWEHRACTPCFSFYHYIVLLVVIVIILMIVILLAHQICTVHTLCFCCCWYRHYHYVFLLLLSSLWLSSLSLCRRTLCFTQGASWYPYPGWPAPGKRSILAKYLPKNLNLGNQNDVEKISIEKEVQPGNPNWAERFP